VIVATLLALPAVFSDFYSDDSIQIAQLEGWAPPRGTTFDLFNFGSGGSETAELIQRGPLPWWTALDYRVHFFRPLSSAFLTLEHMVFGRGAMGYHLVSLLLQAALIAVVAALFRRTLPKLWALSLFLFAIDEAHAEAVGWIAANNSIISLGMSVLSIIAYLRYREDGWKPGMVLALAAAMVSALAGEAGVGALAYVLTYQLVGVRARGRVVDHLRRLVDLWPFALVLLPHIAAYRIGGYGSRGHMSYLDPTGDVSVFLENVGQRVLALFGNLVLGSPIVLWWKSATFRVILVSIGVVALLLVIRWVRIAATRVTEDEMRHVRWFWLGSLLSLLPTSAGPIGMPRVMVVATLGIAPLLALLLHDGWSRLRDRSASTLRRAAAGVGFAMIAVPNLIFSVLMFLVANVSMVLLSKYSEHMTSETDRVVSESSGGSDTSSKPLRVLVISSDDLVTLLYVPYLRRDHPRWRSLWTLAPLATSETLRRLDARTIEIVTSDRFFTRPVDVALSGGRIPRLGTSVRLDGAEVTVTEERDSHPSRVTLRFDTAHDLDQIRLVRWRDREVYPVTLPDVGQDLAMESFQPSWLFR